MSIDKNGILKFYAECEGKREQFVIDPDKMSSGDKLEEMLREMKINEKADKIEDEAKQKRTNMRTNIEYIKAALNEIGEWLSSTNEPLTPEIKQKFVSVEDEAKRLAR
ncbi:hypothetical protein FO519_010841, partial [Halicephalobus sp. NKZ332]